MHPINHPNVIHVSNAPVETPEGGIEILSWANFSQGICINKVTWRVLWMKKIKATYTWGLLLALPLGQVT